MDTFSFNDPLVARYLRKGIAISSWIYMRHGEEGWILIGGSLKLSLYAKKFRKIIALAIDRSVSLGAKRFSANANRQPDTYA